ncbi:glycosyl transferase [Thalassotalea insulae]|uniref:Glycosyl transferase n=1 Tax=Thalassotalea insulae TaxID=2056778 RepID=A0ABQ6GRG5_9GAMM|nr:MJ1255/VC2487 family glycosyltransferase [Thalassotalea insulae]GLX77281.1 glycosyl transferase [Thalassotalea insulae]
MKILYGVQGTGNGHISRSRVMAKYLTQHDVEVTYLLSGREKSQLFDMDIFGDYLHFPGLTFKTNQGKIDYTGSLFVNNMFKFFRDVAALDVEPYDLVITDFEPITAWAAKRANKALLAIGHQYAFGANTPVAGKSVIAAKILQHFAPAEQSLGLHWSHYDNNVLPPIIDVNLKRQSEQGPIVVYLPFEDQAQVVQLLQQFPQQNFIQYSAELSAKTLANVEQKKTCYQGFKQDLVQAKAVICNSGFELNSECIHLGIPILTKPIQGQMEQQSNALALAQLGYGKVMQELSFSSIDNWLVNLSSQTICRYPDVAKEIVNWLLSGRQQAISELSAQLWHQVPNSVEVVS